MPFNRDTIFGLGIPIKVALVKAGMFQGEAARILGIPASTFNMKLLGRRKWTQEERTKLAEILVETEDALFPLPHDNSESVPDTQEESLNVSIPLK